MSQNDPAFDSWVEQARSWDPLEVAQGFGFRPINRAGTERCGPCPSCGGKDRFAVVVRGLKQGVFNCRACGVHGAGAIDMAMMLGGLDFAAACEHLAGPRPSGTVWTDEKRRAYEAEQARRAAERAEKERKREADSAAFREEERKRLWRWWSEADPLVENEAGRAYLEGRGLEVPDLCVLRVHPDLPYFHGETERGDPRVLHRGPVMLGAFMRADGHFAGLHMTFLDVARPGKKIALTDPDTGEALPAKKMRGTKAGSYIPITGAAALAARRLQIGEGIENVLAVRTALVRARRAITGDAFWAAGDIGNLGGPAAATVAHPSLVDKAGRPRRVPNEVPGHGPAIAVPTGVSEVVLIGDGDSDPFTTRLAMRRAAQRFARIGRTVRIAWPEPGRDFNDMLQAAE